MDRSRAFLLVYLIIQVIIPLLYYFPIFGEGDYLDERFAWRMLSELSMKGVKIRMYDEKGREVNMKNIFGEHLTGVITKLGHNRLMKKAVDYSRMRRRKKIHLHRTVYLLGAKEPKIDVFESDERSNQK
jgi:hypothetical protein